MPLCLGVWVGLSFPAEGKHLRHRLTSVGVQVEAGLSTSDGPGCRICARYRQQEKGGGGGASCLAMLLVYV